MQGNVVGEPLGAIGMAARYDLIVAHRVRSVENLPEEAADLAEAASRLIRGHEENRRAFAELAAILGAGTVGAGVATTGATPAVAVLPALPLALAALARLMRERLEPRATMMLPSAERELWEDAGASFDPVAIQQDAINAAVAFADLLARSVEGDGAVASMLRVDRSRVSQRVRDRSLYALTHGETRYFPQWQFADDGTLPGLRQVVAALDARLHPLVVDHWFTTPSVDLQIGDVPVSPVTWLRTGGDPRVVAELAGDL